MEKINRYFINYAGGDQIYYDQQIKSIESAKKYLNFDHYIAYNRSDIDLQFYEKNKSILDQSRGNGYWLWKPYFIKKTLDSMSDGDLLFYLDIDHLFNKQTNLKILYDLIDSDEKQMIAFELPDSRVTLLNILKKEFYGIVQKIDEKKRTMPEMKEMMLDVYDKLLLYINHNKFILNTNYSCTKRDCFILMNLDEDYYYNSIQCAAGYIFLKKNNFTLKFVDEWLQYSQDARAITDQINSLGKSNLPGYTHHRHDQSIYSLLVKKYNVQRIQWSNFHNKIMKDINEK